MSMTQLEELIQRRAELGAEVVILLFKIVLILLLPVAGALYATNLLSSLFSVSRLVAIPFTLLALAVSWVSIWKIYRKVDLEMTNLDKQIKDLKIQEEGYDPMINKKRQDNFDKQDTNE